MDFNKFDSRALAEAGALMTILDANTGEPIMDNGKPCCVRVRGVASKSMQAKMRERQKAAMMKRSAKKKSKIKEDPEAQVMEDIHLQLVEGAAPYIIGFENVERGGEPATADDAEWFLDLTFPEMGMVTDDEGKPVMNETFEEDGTKSQTPSFEMKNNPFAKQVGEFASKQANFLAVDSEI